MNRINSSHPRPEKIVAFCWTAFLGAFFFLVYGFANWVTSRRPGVGTFYFQWERGIPFVPWMIVPYMSLDLFYAGAPFLCQTRAELRSLARRIIFAVLVSASCFLLFPLRFAFERPEVQGLPGTLFALLTSFDRPYNLVPSLHIAFQLIVLSVYQRHTEGLLRGTIQLWFLVIGVSTLLTYQHHVLDVISGYILGILSCYLFREPRRVGFPARADLNGSEDRWRAPNARVGVYYLGGSLAASALGFATWPWGVVLLWPAFSLAVIAAAYLGLGEAVFRKSNGQIPLSAALLLAPHLLGARVYHARHFRRMARPYLEVIPGLLMGRRLSEGESAELVRGGATAVLDLTAEYSETTAFRRLAYANVPVLDLTRPTLPALNQAVSFIRRHAASGSVYIHCALGYSRSATVAAAFLLAEGVCGTVDEAVAKIRAVRPEAVMQFRQLRALEAFRRILY